MPIIVTATMPKYCSNLDYRAATQLDALGKGFTLLGALAEFVPDPRARAFATLSVAGGGAASLLSQTYIARYYPDVHRNSNIGASLTFGRIVGGVTSSAIVGFAAGNGADWLLNRFIGDPC